MKKLKISVILMAFFISCLFFGGCYNSKFLEEKVVYFKSDILSGEQNDISVTCNNYWKKVNDEKVYCLSFYLNGLVSANVSYYISFNLNGKDYTEKFAFDPLYSNIHDNFTNANLKQKELNVEINYGNEKVLINLKSVIDKNVISIKQALNSLQQNQQGLIKHYTDKNGNFTANIILKISVINQKCYYFLEFNGDNVKNVAFLLNALNGEVLAIRNAT